MKKYMVLIISIVVIGLTIIVLGLYINSTKTINNLSEDVIFNKDLNNDNYIIKRTDAKFVLDKKILSPKQIIDKDSTDFARICMYDFEHEKYAGQDPQTTPSISFGCGNDFSFYDHDEEVFDHEYYSCYDTYTYDKTSKIVTIYKTNNNEEYCKKVKNKDTIKILDYKVNNDKLELKIKIGGKEVTYVAPVTITVLDMELPGKYLIQKTNNKEYKMTLNKDKTGEIVINDKTKSIKYRIVRINDIDYIYFYDDNNTLNFRYELSKIK